MWQMYENKKFIMKIFHRKIINGVVFIKNKKKYK